MADAPPEPITRGTIRSWLGHLHTWQDYVAALLMVAYYVAHTQWGFTLDSTTIVEIAAIGATLRGEMERRKRKAARGTP